MRLNLYCILISLISISDSQTNFKSDQVLDLIRNAGYHGEACYIETDDGYILKLHRIIPENPNGRQPIFIMHGIAASAADFLVTGKNIGLAYLFSDLGYDVWLGNARGSKHSTGHRTFHPDSKEYWRFSWHQMGFYDLASMIDYTLWQTGAPNLYYIAHSQGTTSLLVLLACKPEYNRKILQAHLMAPPAFRRKLPKSLLVLSLLRDMDTRNEVGFVDLSRWFRIGEIVGNIICRDNDLFVFKICTKLIGRGFGDNGSKELEIDPKLLPNLFKYLSPRVSTMQFRHYYQNMIADKFRLFDYKENNILHYNSTTPPDYNLSNVVVPTYLYHAALDNFITTKGVSHLRTLLPNVWGYRIINNWNHIDFIYSKYSRDILYRDILKSIDRGP